MKKIIKENFTFILIFILLLLNILSIMPSINDISNYNMTLYLFNYDFGFISRGLIGTILKMIAGKVTISSIYIFVFVTMLLLLILISYIINNLIKKYNKEPFIIILSLLLIYNQAPFILMFQQEYSRFDYLLLINAIISTILIYKNKYTYLIPPLSIISMLIHQNFFFVYFPLTCALLLYQGYKKDKTLYKILILNIISTIIALIIIYTIGKSIPFKDTISYAKYLQSKTDINVVKEVLEYEIFYSFKDHLALCKRVVSTDIKNTIYIISTIAIYLIVLIKYVFKYIINKDNYKYLFLCLLSTFGSIPLFFIAVDYGRWIVFINSAISILAIFMLFEEKEKIIKYKDNINKKIIIFITLLVFFIYMFPTNSYCFMFNNKLNNITIIIKSIIKKVIGI